MAKVQGAPDFVSKEIARLTKMKVSQSAGQSGSQPASRKVSRATPVTLHKAACLLTRTTARWPRPRRCSSANGSTPSRRSPERWTCVVASVWSPGPGRRRAALRPLTVLAAVATARRCTPRVFEGCVLATLYVYILLGVKSTTVPRGQMGTKNLLKTHTNNLESCGCEAASVPSHARRPARMEHVHAHKAVIGCLFLRL